MYKTTRICKCCGRTFEPEFGRQVHCSATCRERYTKRYKRLKKDQKNTASEVDAIHAVLSNKHNLSISEAALFLGVSRPTVYLRIRRGELSPIRVSTRTVRIPIEQLMELLDKALDAGYTVAWGGDVSGDFTRTGLAMLPDGVTPTQQLRQEQWDDWRFTYDHVMLIYGKAIDENGKPYYMVKNSWGKSGDYKGIWYMSRDYMTLNTTYLFLNRHALPTAFLKTMK